MNYQLITIDIDSDTYTSEVFADKWEATAAKWERAIKPSGRNVARMVTGTDPQKAAAHIAQHYPTAKPTASK